MKILVFAASNSHTSINKKLVTSVSKYYKEVEDQKEIIDLNDYAMPIFSKQYEEQHGIPEKTSELVKKIEWADLLLISFAENNGNYNE